MPCPAPCPGICPAYGTINIISKQPSHDPEASFEAGYGNYGLVKLGGFVSGPVSSNLFASVAANYTYHNGYLENIAPGGHDIGEANRGGVRAQLRWEPTANFDATTRVDFSQGSEYFDSFSTLTLPTAFPSLANTIIGDYSKVAINTPQINKTKSGGVSEEMN